MSKAVWRDEAARGRLEVWYGRFTAGGVVDLYLLFFIHVGSRRVIVSAPTASPDSAWVAQQVRNASVQMADWNLPATHLLIDHDTKADRPRHQVRHGLRHGVRGRGHRGEAGRAARPT